MLQTKLEEAGMEQPSNVQRVGCGAGSDEGCIGEGVGWHRGVFHVTERLQSRLEVASPRVGGDDGRPEHNVSFVRGVEHSAC